MVRIADRILINPSQVSSIEEIQMLYNLSRGVFQEKKLENKEIRIKELDITK